MSTQATTDPAARPRRILVVDDERDAADALRVLLETGGDVVQAVYSGRSALDAARAEPPDLIVCDVLMPGMDGHAVARAVRETPSLKGTVLIALTGQGSREAVARCRAAGYDGYLLKPIRYQIMKELIDALCPRKPWANEA
jgi:CheY-like chemotaxis protein